MNDGRQRGPACSTHASDDVLAVTDMPSPKKTAAEETAQGNAYNGSSVDEAALTHRPDGDACNENCGDGSDAASVEEISLSHLSSAHPGGQTWNGGDASDTMFVEQLPVSHLSTLPLGGDSCAVPPGGETLSARPAVDSCSGHASNVVLTVLDTPRAEENGAEETAIRCDASDAPSIEEMPFDGETSAETTERCLSAPPAGG